MDRRNILDRVALAAFFAATALSLPLVGGFFGALHPALDSLAHFRVHLAAALILTAIPLVLTSRFRWNGLIAVLLGGWAIMNVTGLATNYGPAAVHASSDREPTQASDQASDAAIYRLLHLNLLSNNPEPEKLLSLLGRIRPDVVTLAEVSPMWVTKLKLVQSTYRYQLICSKNGAIGDVAILSLRPVIAEPEEACVPDGSFASVPVDFGGRIIDVGAIHLLWPWPMGQAEQIDQLAPRLGDMSETAILAGDLNATPWSAASQRVAALAGMQAAGPNDPTWLLKRLPRWLGFAGLPIDRVFTKGDVVVRSIQTLDWVGSDHRPVLMEFSLKDVVPKDDEATTATALLSPSH